MNLQQMLDRIFGPRIDDDDGEGAKLREQAAMLVKHRLTLQQVNSVLSDSQRAVADAIDETGHAIELHGRR